QLAASLAQEERRPRSIADRQWRKAMFGDHPYARRLRGSVETIAAITVDDLPAHAAPGTVPPLKPREAGETLVAKLPIPQSVVVFGQPGLKRDDPDWY